MAKTYPGTTIEVSKLSRGDSRTLFDGVFAAGGITLSQVAVMTGLEPYVIQNWVKRGFVTPPQKRVYSREQLSRIILINMLKESLQIDRICALIRLIVGDPKDRSDDLILESELYHRYVDLLASGVMPSDTEAVTAAVTNATDGLGETRTGAKVQLMKILRIMLYAHAAARLREDADNELSALLG